MGAEGRWINFADAHTFSGWKAHVHCETPADVTYVINKLWDVIEELKLGAKAASYRFYEYIGDPEHPQFGKGVVVFFPRRHTWVEDLDAVCDALEGYWHRNAFPRGNVPVRNGVSWRFELEYDPGYDVDYLTYRNLYRPAH